MNTKIFKNVISWGLVMSMILSLLPVNMFTALAAESTVFTHIGLNFETFYPGSIVSVYVDNNYGVDSGSGGSLGDNKFLLDRDRYTVKYTYNGNEVIGQWFEIPEDAKSTDILTCTITDNETGNYEIRNITIDDSKAEDRYRKNDINGESFSVYYSGEAINRSFGLQGETWPINYYYTFLKDGKPVTEDDVEYSYFGSGSGFKISTLTDELVNQMEGHFYTLTCHYVPTHTYYLYTDRGEASLYYGDSVHNFIVGTPVSGVKAVYNEDTGIVTATVSVNGNEIEGYEVKWYRGTDENEIGNEIKTSSTYDYEKIKEDEGYEIYAKVKIAESRYSSTTGMHDAVWITSNKVEIPTDAWKVMSAKLNPVQPQVGRSVQIQNIIVKKGEIEKELPNWPYVKYEYSIDEGELQEISTNSISIPSDAGGKELRVVITGKGLADDKETYIGSVELKAIIYDSAMKKTITSAVLHNGEKYAHPGDILTLKVEPEDATYILWKYVGGAKVSEITNPTEEDFKVTEDDLGKQIYYSVRGNGLFYNSNKISNVVAVINHDTKIYDAQIVNEKTGISEVAVGETAKLVVTDQKSGEELTLGEDFTVTTWKYYTLDDNNRSTLKNIENSANTLQQTLTLDQYTEMCKYGDMYNTPNRLYADVKGLGEYEYINKSSSTVAIETPSSDKKELTVTLGEAVYDETTDEYTLNVTVGPEGVQEGVDYTLSNTLYIHSSSYPAGNFKLIEGKYVGKPYNWPGIDNTAPVICKLTGKGDYAEVGSINSNTVKIKKYEEPDIPTTDKLTITDSTVGKEDPSTTNPGNTLVADVEINEEGVTTDNIVYTWYVETADGVTVELGSHLNYTKELKVPNDYDIIGGKVYVVVTCSDKPEFRKESDKIEIKSRVTEDTNSGECNVIVSQGQSFKVTIPAFVSLDGKKNDLNQNKAQFNTVVVADIAGKDSIEVKPACEGLTFKMEEAGGIKKALDAVIEGSTEGWVYQIGSGCTEEQLSTEGITRTHTITVSNLSAGRWTGTFDWRIVTTGNKIDDSVEHVDYKQYDSKTKAWTDVE